MTENMYLKSLISWRLSLIPVTYYFDLVAGFIFLSKADGNMLFT